MHTIFIVSTSMLIPSIFVFPVDMSTDSECNHVGWSVINTLTAWLGYNFPSLTVTRQVIGCLWKGAGHVPILWSRCPHSKNPKNNPCIMMLFSFLEKFYHLIKTANQFPLCIYKATAKNRKWIHVRSCTYIVRSICQEITYSSCMHI